MSCFVVPELLMLERPTSGLALAESPPNCCCKHPESTKDWVLRRLHLLRKRHWWLDEQIVLPMPIKKGGVSSQKTCLSQVFVVHTDFCKDYRLFSNASLNRCITCISFWSSSACLSVFCEACQDKPGLYAKVSGMLPMRVASYMLMPYTLPVQSAYSVAQR